MNRTHLLASLSLAALGALFTPTALSQSASAPVHAESALQLYVGDTQTLNFPSDVARIAIGNGKVLSASNISGREVLLVANDAGEARLTVWLKDRSQRHYTVRVTLNNMARIATEVRALFRNDPNVVVNPVGDKIFFEATDLDALQVKKVEALEKAYAAQFVPIIGGQSNLRERTIYMQAQIIEIRRSALDNLGVRWAQEINGPSVSANGRATVQGSGSQVVNPLVWTFALATDITSRINLLEQRGDAYVIASPQLTSRCGGEAEFTAGGELPIPIASGPGQISVEYKPYGVRLEIAPLCDTRGNIRANLGMELSQIDPSVMVMGVPGLLTRRADTQLDLMDGRAMLVSGLSQLRASDVVDQVPGIGNVPVLGNLFRNKDLNGERTELVLLITPSVVTPDSLQVVDRLGQGSRLAESAEERLRQRKVLAPDATIPAQTVAPLPPADGVPAAPPPAR